MKKTLPLIAISIGAILPSYAAVTLTIDPVGGEQDGVEFDTVTGAETLSMADMQAAVINASPGMSGVFDMENTATITNNRIGDAAFTSFAVITNVTTNVADHGSIQATSGENAMWIRQTTDLTFDLGTTGSSGVTAFGFVNTPWRDGGGLVFDLDVTATFSGGGTTTLTTDEAEAFLVINPTAGNGTYDTWFGFQAPAGETITSVLLTEADASGNWSGADDMAFVLEPVNIPEPSSTALLGLGAVALIFRRRK